MSSWEVAINGTETARAETMEQFARAFEPAGFRRQAFQPCYGLAEATYFVTGGVSWSRTRAKSFDSAGLRNGKAIPAAPGGTSCRLVSCGYASVDHCRALVVDPVTRTECVAGQVGEIWLSGGSVARSYWDRPEQTQEVFGARLAGTGDGPFARSGDVGFVLDHELFVTGRLTGPDTDRAGRPLVGAKAAPSRHGVRSPHWEHSVLSLHELEPGTVQHRVAAALRCRGELDASALGRALDALVARHAPAAPYPGREPGQWMIGTTRSLPQENDTRDIDDAGLRQWLEHAAHEPLDLASGQLLRTQLYRKATDETIVLIVAHRFITDFWSITTLVRELEALYSEQDNDAPAPLPELTHFIRHYCWVSGARVPACSAAQPA